MCAGGIPAEPIPRRACLRLVHAVLSLFDQRRVQERDRFFLELTAEDDPPYLGGRLVGLVATSSGPIAAVHAIGAMEQIVHALRGYVVPATAPIGPVKPAVDLDAGVIKDERTKLKLVQMVEEMRDALAARA